MCATIVFIPSEVKQLGHVLDATIVFIPSEVKQLGQYAHACVPRLFLFLVK